MELKILFLKEILDKNQEMAETIFILVERIGSVWSQVDEMVLIKIFLSSLYL